MSRIRKAGECPPSVLNSILRTKRTAEGCAWGHSLDDFFSIKPADDERYSWTDIWTTSVFEELGVRTSTDEKHGRAEPQMRTRRPWPVLKLPRGDDSLPSLGVVDPGSDHEDEGESRYPTSQEFAPAAYGSPNDKNINTTLSDGIPKLEELIPEQHLPKLLRIHDPDGRLSGTESTETTLYYRRVFPTITGQTEQRPEPEQMLYLVDRLAGPDVGHLCISRQSRVGCGHHSNVYRTSFRLPEPAAANSPNGRVTIIAKVAVPRQEARDFLSHEAATYDTFPTHLAQEFCGYALVPGLKYPVPVSAVVPKFYGYYIPEYAGYDPRNIAEPSPIILLEECGSPIDPQNLSHDSKAECFSMFLRLHTAGVLQKSAFKKNILIQPGPLTAPPSARSMESPSFRIIDFGRAIRRPFGNQKGWLDEKEGEVKDVQKVLRIPRYSMS